ncbi:MAG: hypothetical protein ACO2OX_00285 [Candidatus Nanopusillus sp.]
MNSYISCLYERNYHDYFQCIRNYKNPPFTLASYFIRIGSKTEAIPKNLIFPTIYGHISSMYQVLSEDSYLIVLLKKENEEDEKYITDIGKRRMDIYLNEPSRTKTPESILLINLDDKNDLKKLIEARAYNFKTRKDMEKLLKKISQKLDNVFYVPLSLSLILLIINSKFFPKIYYISRPYTIETPYVYKIVYKSSGITKKPIKIFNKDLNFLSIIDFERYPTIEPYSLGLDYDFELDQRNLNNFEIQINYDDFEHKLYSSMAKTAEKISISGVCPADISPYQIIRDNNGDIRFIDFADGFDVSISQKGLEKIIIKAIKDIIVGIKESPLLKHCMKVGNNVVCNEKIINPNFPKMLVRNIEEQLEDYDNKPDILIRKIIIGDSKLSDIIYQPRKDEFEKNREIISRALELYLKSYNN